MNKFQKELLSKCKEVKKDKKIPLLDVVYILPTTRKHDSGYKIMYIVGYAEKTKQYYLLDGGCDVINFGDMISQFSQFKGLNIDIHDNGIIQCWSRTQKMKSVFRVSSCTFGFVDRR